MLSITKNVTSALLREVDAYLTDTVSELKAGLHRKSAVYVNPLEDMSSHVVKLQVQLDFASDRVDADVQKLLRQFTALESVMVSDFREAIDAVSTLTFNETDRNVSQTPHRATKWPLSWLFDHKDKFQAALSSVTKANSTVAKIEHMLDSLDEQAANLIRENTLWTTQLALQRLRSQVNSNTTLARGIPRRAASAHGELERVERTLDAKVNTTINTIHAYMSVARAALPSLYTAAEKLMALAKGPEEVPWITK